MFSEEVDDVDISEPVVPSLTLLECMNGDGAALDGIPLGFGTSTAVPSATAMDPAADDDLISSFLLLS